MPFPDDMDDAALLAEALNMPREAIQLRSREPLGDGSVAGFDVLAAVDGPDGTPPLRYYVDTSRLSVPTETGMVLSGEDLVAEVRERPVARIWLHPADPYLPALVPVAFDTAAQTMLARLGAHADGPAEFVGYRPGRRAVLKIRTAGGPLWLKILRPSRLARTVAADAAFRDAGLPVPGVRGWSPEGLIVFEQADGTPAAEFPWEPTRLIDEVDRLRGTIAAVDLPHSARGIRSRLDWYRQRARRGPAALQVFADLIDQVAQHPLTAPIVTVHGDLHYGQLFLDGQHRIAAVIDTDTAGQGSAAEDPAAFIAHACASAHLTHPGARQRVWRLTDEALQRWGEEPDVPLFTAIHLLGHALAAEDSGAKDRVREFCRAGTAILQGRSPSP